MLKSTLTTTGLAALAGAAMLTLSMTPASAFTLASPSLAPPVAAAQIDRVWWDRWGNWHSGPRWGGGFQPFYQPYYQPDYQPEPLYRPNHRHCWRGYSGRLHCSW